MKNQQTCRQCGKECTSTHPKDFLAGALLGGILGATTALLLAPKSGSELRQDISEKIQDLTENAQEISQNIQEKGENLANNARAQASHWVDHARDLLESLTSESRQQNGVCKTCNHSHAEDLLEWADLGIRLWKKATKK